MAEQHGLDAASLSSSRRPAPNTTPTDGARFFSWSFVNYLTFRLLARGYARGNMLRRRPGDPREIKESDQSQRRKDNKEAALRALRRSASAASDPSSIIEAAGSRINLCAAASSI